jgi:multicomponent Na+:H+ antiporter subunit C
MELAMALLVAVMVGAGTYTILQPSLLRIVMGLGLYGNAANLVLITAGGYSSDLASPFVEEGSDPLLFMDPLPPDIILTAIVINFAVGAFLLVLCYCVFADHGTDSPEHLAGEDGP